MLDLLSGIRVVSFNHFLLGPMGIQALGDLGADVISVENSDGAWQRHWSCGDLWHDGQSMLHLCANRNKRSVAIDLKSEKGREIALRLVDTADVVSENFRPGVMAKLGLDYETLKARKPDLIYASASGYGPDGPYAERPGQDLLAQALFGLMAITGQASTGPRPVGASVVDHHGAALFAMGILAAIVRRQRTGQGCRVDASLMQAALDLQMEPLVSWLNAAEKPRSIHTHRHVAGWHYAAPYGVYATKDGHILFMASEREFWKNFCEGVGRPELFERWPGSQFGDHARGNTELRAILREIFASKSSAEWLAFGLEHNTPIAPSNTPKTIRDDPQFQDRLPWIPASKVGAEMLPCPIKFVGETIPDPTMAPTVGEHTESVLREVLGWDDSRIEQARAAGAFGKG